MNFHVLRLQGEKLSLQKIRIMISTEELKDLIDRLAALRRHL